MPVSRDNVVSLFWNLLRRAPSEADINAHMKAESVAVLAQSFASCHEFLSNMVREAYVWWLKRQPVEREIAEWANNFRRLGQVGGLRQLTATRESLQYCIDPGQPGSIVPPSEFWSGTQYGNALIRWYKQREPYEPKEGLRYALQVQVGSGVFSGFQMHDMVAGEPDSVDTRVRRNYLVLLGREITPAEFVHWRTLAAANIWIWQIAASPEGLAYGSTLSRQRSLETLAATGVPPAPVQVAGAEVPAGYFSFKGAP